MSKDIIVALIALTGVLVTAGGSIVTQIVLAKQSREKMMAEIKHQFELDDAKLDAKLDKHQAISDVKIDELTREVRKHNNFAQRVPVMEEQIRVANHRIADLERFQEQVTNDGK